MFKKKGDIIPDRKESLSNELNEFILSQPHWLVRKGNAIFFIILFMVFIIAWFVKYPKIIKGSVHLVESFNNTYSGKMMIAKQDLKEIRTGQQLKLKITGLPNRKANYLNGSVDHISATPINDSFLLDIKLTSGPKINNASSPIFRNNLSAEAEIVSDDNRLLNHVLGGLKRRF